MANDDMTVGELKAFLRRSIAKWEKRLAKTKPDTIERTEAETILKHRQQRLSALGK